MPSREMQKKIDFFMTPYNKTKSAQKYMTFQNDEDMCRASNDETTNENWNRLSNLILSKDNKTFRKTLL